MPEENQKLHRRSIRLPEYDYSGEGAYYFTLCTQGRACLFGEIINGRMTLNQNGEIVKQELLRTPEIRREMTLDEWIIMPNHIHAIVIINECYDGKPVGATGRSPLQRRDGPQPKSLASLICGFKSSVTKRINLMRNTPGEPIWQRNYWEHIIRDHRSYDKIKRYIMENPLHWATDEENQHTV